MRTFAQDPAFYRKVRVDETDDPEALRRPRSWRRWTGCGSGSRWRRRCRRWGWGAARTASGSGGCATRARGAWFRAAAGRRATRDGSGRWRTRGGCWRFGGRCRGRGRRGSRSTWPSGGRSGRRARRRRGASCGGRWRRGGRSRARSAKGGPPRSGGATSPARMRAGGSRATGTSACNVPPAARFDHMTTHIEGRTLKEVPADSASPAVCPATRRQRARVYSSATAHTARAFPREAAERLDVKAVQVDCAPCKHGGSEFMRHSWRSGFEDECREPVPGRTRLRGDEQGPGQLPRLLQQPPPAPLAGHEDPGRVRYDDGDGCLTSNVQKVGDPPQQADPKIQRWAADRSRTLRSSSPHTVVAPPSYTQVRCSPLIDGLQEGPVASKHPHLRVAYASAEPRPARLGHPLRRTRHRRRRTRRGQRGVPLGHFRRRLAGGTHRRPSGWRRPRGRYHLVAARALLRRRQRRRLGLRALAALTFRLPYLAVIYGRRRGDR